jgi:PmbA protein
MSQARFSHDLAALKSIAADALAHAAKMGASACEAEASDGYGQTVTVRKGEVETIEYNRDKSVGVTVYVGQRKGYASTADFAGRAIRDTVEAALTIARFTAEDEAAGLPTPRTSRGTRETSTCSIPGIRRSSVPSRSRRPARPRRSGSTSAW